MDDRILEQTYQENLEERLIACIADQNGIKAPNLSRALKDMETALNQQLFYRTSHGLVPTETALEIALKAQKIEQIASEIKEKYTLCTGVRLKLYLSEGLEINGFKKLKGRIEIVSQKNAADVIISTKKPSGKPQMIAVRHQIGNHIKQNIWVLAKNTPEAMALTAEIILMFQD